MPVSVTLIPVRAEELFNLKYDDLSDLPAGTVVVPEYNGRTRIITAKAGQHVYVNTFTAEIQAITPLLWGGHKFRRIEANVELIIRERS